MPNYDFTKLLSAIDFELLSKDLLEAELGIQLENFSEGKDKGVDLRYAPEKGEKVIVQCKRYSKYSDLKSNLVNRELSKIQELNPDKYILTTSASLSPQQVDEIALILSPFIKSTGDIFGRDRLNKLLDEYSEIERRHIKLWVGSKGVLESILNAGTHIVSREEVERTIASAKIYVQNDSFEEALSILKDQHVCIISGLPGIGKTTLARMLILYFHEQNFDIIKIESDISEARTVGYHDKPRFYYYDDFLGQTGRADKLNKNEDQKLIDFMCSIRDSKNSFFVLTTREYLLNQAKLCYEKLEREDFEHKTCLLDLSKYSRASKARILYNHLHFSNLPRPYLECLIEDDRYITIIDHENYNPRLIEAMTSSDWVGNIVPEEYSKTFIEAFDNPVRIWEHAFENQISDRARNLLVILTTFSKEVLVDDLEKAFWNFHQKQCAEFGIKSSPQDFKSSLKELEGTFVEIQEIDNTKIVRIKNGSVRDFMKSVLMDDQWLQGIVNSLIFFEQAHWIFETLIEWNEDSTVDNTSLKYRNIAEMLKSLIDADCSVFEISSITKEITRQKGNPAFRLASIAKATSAWNIKADSEYIISGIDKLADQLEETMLSWRDCADAVRIFNSFGYLNINSSIRFVSCLKSDIKLGSVGLVGFSILGSIIIAIPLLFTESELKEICDQFIKFAEEYVKEDDYKSSSDAEAIRTVVSLISHIGKALKIDISSYQETLCTVAEQVERETAKKLLRHSEGDISYKEESISDTEIGSIFNTLITT